MLRARRDRRIKSNNFGQRSGAFFGLRMDLTLHATEENLVLLFQELDILDEFPVGLRGMLEWSTFLRFGLVQVC